MEFSWEKARADTIENKIRRAKTMAKSGLNKDFKIAHTDWVSQAQQNNYKDLEVKIRALMIKKQNAALDRRQRFVS